MKKPSLRTAVIPHITAVLLYVSEASFLLHKKEMRGCAACGDIMTEKSRIFSSRVSENILRKQSG